MNFDQERVYLNSQCLEYDVDEMLHIMIDMAFEPRS